ncbi:hypothetical protein GA0115252_12557 [Streptomyces sp. DfronAA-171]|nr:hypothetical protein GA0115252_12557 [Streptomyces sp. DfronAA-171]
MAFLNVASRSPRTVIGSFGTGSEPHILRYFAGSKVPDSVALASCWELISAASTVSLVRASSASG